MNHDLAQTQAGYGSGGSHLRLALRFWQPARSVDLGMVGS